LSGYFAQQDHALGKRKKGKGAMLTLNTIYKCKFCLITDVRKLFIKKRSVDKFDVPSGEMILVNRHVRHTAHPGWRYNWR